MFWFKLIHFTSFWNTSKNCLNRPSSYEIAIILHEKYILFRSFSTILPYQTKNDTGNCTNFQPRSCFCSSSFLWYPSQGVPLPPNPVANASDPLSGHETWLKKLKAWGQRNGLLKVTKSFSIHGMYMYIYINICTNSFLCIPWKSTTMKKMVVQKPTYEKMVVGLPGHTHVYHCPACLEITKFPTTPFSKTIKSHTWQRCQRGTREYHGHDFMVFMNPKWPGQVYMLEHSSGGRFEAL